ncbi:MAG: hypothetical protein OEV09_04115 [Deltaproteobacteria bacterium]|nr:hypothetical protein [Deltaproteobacteria bacterium]
MLSRDREDGRATWQPQDVGSEAYLERYVAGTDIRGRQEGRPHPWSQQVIHEISGLGSLKINHLNHIQFHLRSRKLSMEKNNKGYNRKRKDWQMNAVKNVICAATGQNIGVVKYGDLGWVSLCF